jgi:beta-aspartyl-peptidase (threonine type)
MSPVRIAAVLIPIIFLSACGPADEPVEGRPEWVLVIHGGAGVMSRDGLSDSRQAYAAGLKAALDAGAAVLDRGGSALDAVETVLVLMEDDPLYNAGRGAVYTLDGGHELDASIMNGADHANGAVTGVTTVRNPIRLARLVMERSKHVLFAGPGAEEFANSTDLPRVENRWFDTEERRKALEKAGTVGCVALDRNGDLAAGTSTGGLTGKRFGRVGDSPIVGAGTWADNRTCAVSCTGTGEEFIRYGVAQRVGDMMEYGGFTLAEASEQVVHGILQEGDGGLIALDRSGNAVMVYNTGGMFRGIASSDGKFEVAIWDETEPIP